MQNAAAVAEATTTAKAAAAVATTKAKTATVIEANAAKAAAAALNGIAATEAENLNSNNQHGKAQQAGAVTPSHTVAGAVDTGASTAERGRQAPPSRNTGSGDPTQEEDHQQDIVDWDLTNENALTEGSTL